MNDRAPIYADPYTRVNGKRVSRQIATAVVAAPRELTDEEKRAEAAYRQAGRELEQAIRATGRLR